MNKLLKVVVEFFIGMVLGFFMFRGLGFLVANAQTTSSLTQSQVSAIVSLLEAFNVDQQTIITVENELSPQSTELSTTTDFTLPSGTIVSNTGELVKVATAQNDTVYPLSDKLFEEQSIGIDTITFVVQMNGTDGDFWISYGPDFNLPSNASTTPIINVAQNQMQVGLTRPIDVTINGLDWGDYYFKLNWTDGKTTGSNYISTDPENFTHIDYSIPN